VGSRFFEQHLVIKELLPEQPGWKCQIRCDLKKHYLQIAIYLPLNY
jgi:hypothetical protein